MQQEQDEADARQDVADARDAGDGGVQGAAQVRPPDLGQAPQQEAEAGNVQSGLIGRQDPSGLGGGEGKGFFRQHQQEEEEHPQHEVVGVQEGQTRPSGEAAEFGKFTVKYAKGHGDDSVGQGKVGTALDHRGTSSDLFEPAFAGPK